MCCSVKTPKPSGLSLPDCALAAPHSAAYQGGKPRFIKIKKKILLLAALTRQRVGRSDDCEFTLLRTRSRGSGVVIATQLSPAHGKWVDEIASFGLCGLRMDPV